MRKKFGPYNLINNGKSISVNKIILTYRLGSLTPQPSLEVYGTTFDGATNVLVSQKLIRSTECNTRQTLTDIISFDSGECGALYFYINNYESICRLYNIDLGYSSAKSIPSTNKADGDIEQCVTENGTVFRIKLFDPADGDSGVSLDVTPEISFNQLIDKNSIHTLSVEFFYDDGLSEMEMDVYSNMNMRVDTFGPMRMDLHSQMDMSGSILGDMDMSVRSVLEMNLTPFSNLDMSVYSNMDMSVISYGAMRMNVVSQMRMSVPDISDLRMRVDSVMDMNVELLNISPMNLSVWSLMDMSATDASVTWTDWDTWE